MKLSRGEKIYVTLLHVIMILAGLICLLPVLNVFARSLSSVPAVAGGKVWFWPVEFNPEGWKYVLQRTSFLNSMGNSVIITLLGTVLSVFVTILTAYSLSRPYLKGRKVVIYLYVFMMIFNAGILPNYFQIKGYGLLNTRWALILPTLFCENFECLDDYAGTAYFASFLRVLKYISFYLSIFLPGVFVCWAVYLPELLPPQLLFKIEAAEQATPLPLFGEMLLVILMLEIIREAGLRMPQTLGHSVSLIAALIIGDAAIAAGLMSTPVILTAAAASIAVFVTPSLYEVATVLRLVVLLAAGVAGPVGLAACALGVLFGLTRVSALGVPYLRDAVFPEVPLSPDGVTRRSYPKLSRRPFTIWQKRGG